MKKNLLQKMITVSRMYFEENLTQEEIAERLGVSVPQISRLISQAKRDGYIKIQVIDPFQDSSNLRERLLAAFPLKDARIVESRAANTRLTEENVAQAAADYLMDILKANDIVGVGFSEIISRIPNLMPHRHVENVFFVQMGGVVSEHVHGYQNDTVRSMAAQVDGFYYFFPSPAFVKDAYVRECLHEDPIARWVLGAAEGASISIYSVGELGRHSPFVLSGYFTQMEMEAIYKRGAVGEIFGHFIDKDGNLCEPELEKRTPGLALSSLAEKEYSICVAANTALTPAVRAAIVGGYCNLLITDACTAEGLLNNI